ncbi:MAG: hypothetical protein ACFB10_03305 [Salibacteraceae bacterium]
MNLKTLYRGLALAMLLCATFAFTSQAQNLENGTLCHVDYTIHYSTNCGMPAALPNSGTVAPSTSIPLGGPSGSFVEYVEIVMNGVTYIVGFPGCGWNDLVTGNQICEFCVDAGFPGWVLHYNGVFQDVTIGCF